MLLKEPTSSKEFKEFGYWTSAEFLPTCGLFPDTQKRLDGKTSVIFRGLIACGRTISRDHGVATLICIGVGNREYVDLVIPEAKRSDLFNWAVLEGKGVQTKPGTIEVSKIKGIAIINVESQTSR
jgi:hypothetical protein